MLKVCLLGKFDVKKDGTPVDIPSRPARSLLAYLILNAGKSHSRERLAGLLWPDSGESSARNNLRQALWRLRKSIGETYLATDKMSVGFNTGSAYWLDVEVLLNGTDPGTAPCDAAAAVEVYQGRLLPGWYDEWVLPEQERLRTVYEDRIQQLLQRLVEQACWQEVRHWAEQWIANGTISEHPYRALMQAHAGLGDRAGTAAVFQRCREALNAELGIDPSPETRGLFRDLTSGKMRVQPGPSPDHDDVPGPAVKLPLLPTPFVGRTREIGLISSLLSDPERRLVTITGPGGMGKTRLAVEAARHQTGAFPGGVYFVSLAPLEDPVFMVSLIAETIGFSFHVRDQREQWEADRQIAQLTGFLKDKQLLLVLDNTEHLLTSALPSMEAWKNGAEAVAADILRDAPLVKILATSRERLNLQGETPIALDGLDFPGQSGTVETPGGEAQGDETREVEACGAVQLFVRTAGQVLPGFALGPENAGDVIEICRRVDGMPLAIQLAAAWIELMPPREILHEIQNSLSFLETDLRDVPVRHRSMRSIFDATWQRLSGAEQDAFRQMALFRGGFTRQAARAVTGIAMPVLRALVNKSLVRPDIRGRYQVHELLRQFGLEQLANAPELRASAQARHCDWFAGFLASLEPDLTGEHQGRALSDIEVEIDNIRAAWKQAVTKLRFDRMEQIMESLCEFYRIRGQLNEGFETFYPTAMALGWQGIPDSGTIPDSGPVFEKIEQILETATGCDIGDSQKQRQQRQRILGKVLARYARFHCESPSGAWQAYNIRQDALKTLAETGELREMAWVLRYMVHIGLKPEETEILYHRAHDIFKQTRDRRGAADILFRLGLTASQLGDFTRAEQLYRESLGESEALGSRQTVMFCLAELGWIHWALGNYTEADALCAQSLPLSGEIGYPSLRAMILRYLSRIALSRGDQARAGQLLEESFAIYDRLGLQGMQAETLGEKARIALVTEDHDRACGLAEESLRICQERTHTTGMIVPLTVLGEARLNLGDPVAAQSHFRIAMQTAADSRMPPHALDALAGAAGLLLALGERERTAGLADYVSQHPAAWQWTRDRATALADKSAVGSNTKDRTLEGVVKDLAAFFS